MFGSQGRGGFGAASSASSSAPGGTMAANPFSQQQQGPASVSNPFQSSTSAAAPTTAFGTMATAPVAFGQSSGFGTSASAAAAPGAPFSTVASTNPFATSSSTATFGASSGFGTSAFAPATTFGGATSSSSSSSSSQFGSSGGAHASPAFGTRKAPASADASSSFASANGFRAKAPGITTAFGKPSVRPKPLQQPPLPPSPATAFGRGAHGAAPPLPPSSSTAFGTQSASSIRVRRKGAQTVDSSAASANVFGAGAGAAPSQTAFGVPAPPPTAVAFGRESGSKKPATASAANPFSATAFESSASGNGFGAASALEARMAGGPKKPAGRAKRSANAPGAAATTSSIDPSGMLPSKKFAARKPTSASAAVGSSDTDSGPFAPASAKPQALQTRKKAQRSAADAGVATPSPALSPSHTSAGGDDANKAELASAVNLEGTCIDMCSPAERELHIRVDELSVFEKCFPDAPGCERDLIIKRFQRSSADHKLDIPSEVRPPGVLRRTQLYIEQSIMDRDRDGAIDVRLQPPRAPDAIELYNFCWDRFRMIRKDFVLQNYRGAGGRVHPIVLDVHERIARYHILSEHELIEVPSFVAQQNMEQLGQTLKSLNELYDESRNTGDAAYLSPFEPEFRAYFMLCALDNGRGLDVLKFVKGLHPTVVASPQVAFAMKVFVARHTHDYYRFFQLLRDATYLQSCLLFRYIPSVRSSALQRMNRAFRNQPYPLVDVMELLCFDDIDHAGTICQHHGLELTQHDPTDDSSIMVLFGGDFETDIQLRKNKRPLPVRSSHVFVGQKQGEYLRKDICRGVTEYYADEYPPLSHLIHELEAAERAAMYPTRPAYTDEYSSFANYTQYDPYQATAAAPSTSQPSAPVRPPAPLAPSAPVSGYGFDPADQPFDDAKQRELEAIAKRKAELERTHQLALQRIQELERAKQAKALAAAEPKQPSASAAPSAPSTGDSTSATAADALAVERAKKDAELLEMQQALERKLREQEAQRQREQAERLKREQEAAAAEAARQRAEAEAERQRQARAAAAEAERTRLEAAKREEEARQLAAAQRERELAAEKERQRREAAVEAARQETLARERAEAKRQRRIKKQQIARLQLRFRIWRKYVRASKALPPPIKFDAARFMAAAHVKPKSAIQWLFKDASAAAAVGTKLRNPSEVMHVPAPRTPSAAHALERSSIWSALDVLALVTPALCKHRRAASAPSLLQWKLAVGDLVDDPTSSFGSWCAAKLGIQQTGALAPFRVFHTSSTELDAPDVAVCCRYVDAAAVDSLSEHEQRTSLRGTAALLLPLALSDAVDDRKRSRWLQRVETLFVRLSAPSHVLVTLLLFANVEPSPATEFALATIESVVRYAQLRVDSVVDVDFAVVPSCGDASSKSPQLLERFTATLVSLARHWVAPRSAVSVRATELLDGAVSAAIQRCAHTASPTTILDSVRFAIGRLRDELAYQVELGASSGDATVPELAAISSAYPSSSSGATDQSLALDPVLRALAAVSIGDMEPRTLTLAPTDVCDHYFAAIADFVDRIFAVRPAHVATLELKKLVYNLLVPVHAQLVRDAPSARLPATAAAAVLPWHSIFREIYAAFAETLDDLSVTVCALWRSEHARELLGLATEPLAVERRAASGFCSSPTLSTSAPAAVAPVALKSLKRSFGVALASSTGSTAPSSSVRLATASSLKKLSSASVRRPVRSDPRVLELRHDIARERAASTRFQHLLRRELNRWDPDAL